VPEWFYDLQSCTVVRHARRIFRRRNSKKGPHTQEFGATKGAPTRRGTKNRRQQLHQHTIKSSLERAAEGNLTSKGGARATPPPEIYIDLFNKTITSRGGKNKY